MLKELGKRILRDANKEKSDAENIKNERYCDNSYTSNGYSFYTNKNLLNTSMSPIHKIGSQCAIQKEEKPFGGIKVVYYRPSQ